MPKTLRRSPPQPEDASHSSASSTKTAVSLRSAFANDKSVRRRISPNENSSGISPTSTIPRTPSAAAVAAARSLATAGALKPSQPSRTVRAGREGSHFERNRRQVAESAQASDSDLPLTYETPISKKPTIPIVPKRIRGDQLNLPFDSNAAVRNTNQSLPASQQRYDLSWFHVNDQDDLPTTSKQRDNFAGRSRSNTFDGVKTASARSSSDQTTRRPSRSQDDQCQLNLGSSSTMPLLSASQPPKFSTFPTLFNNAPINTVSNKQKYVPDLNNAPFRLLHEPTPSSIVDLYSSPRGYNYIDPPSPKLTVRPRKLSFSKFNKGLKSLVRNEIAPAEEQASQTQSLGPLTQEMSDTSGPLESQPGAETVKQHRKLSSHGSNAKSMMTGGLKAVKSLSREVYLRVKGDNGVMELVSPVKPQQAETSESQFVPKTYLNYQQSTQAPLNASQKSNSIDEKPKFSVPQYGSKNAPPVSLDRYRQAYKFIEDPFVDNDQSNQKVPQGTIVPDRSRHGSDSVSNASTRKSSVSSSLKKVFQVSTLKDLGLKAKMSFRRPSTSSETDPYVLSTRTGSVDVDRLPAWLYACEVCGERPGNAEVLKGGKCSDCKFNLILLQLRLTFS